ncbi:MAG: NUDIX domain-containing protein [Alphaproteobacteria bacterium]
MSLRHPPNLRAYGLLRRGGTLLIAAEYVGTVFCWKFPGGGVKADESAERGLRREYAEETGLAITIRRLLHAPGTLLSPWTGRDYTPLFYEVAADGEPVVPAHETVAMAFRTPAEARASGLMAEPETVAMSLLFDGADAGP